MKKKKCIAMLLAGGQGSRLGALTKHIAKPAVSFGGKYRIIDFSLSNCANSHIGTVGVLTQYRPLRLNAYIGTGASWDLDEPDGGVSILPPYATETGGEWYKGTADAVYQNLDYIRMNDPEYVLILSGDHLYRMDYRKMLACHVEHKADLTISVMPVPWEEASRFGIVTEDETGRIVKFSEKPRKPDSNLASMGIYIFSAKPLINALVADAADPDSEHDFGKNIIPKLLADGKRLFGYEFTGYWKDVGTIDSYHETSMELLDPKPGFNLFDAGDRIMSNNVSEPPQYIGKGAKLSESLVSNGCVVLGTVRHSILSTGSYVGKGAVVEDSVLLPGAKVMDGARVVRAIMGENATVSAGGVLGSADPAEAIAVIGDNAVAGGKEAK